MAPFYGWGSSISRLHSHYEEIVSGVPGTQLIDLGRMKKAELALEPPPNSFEHETPGWESGALTTRPLLHKWIKIFNNGLSEICGR